MTYDKEQIITKVQELENAKEIVDFIKSFENEKLNDLVIELEKKVDAERLYGSFKNDAVVMVKKFLDGNMVTETIEQSDSYEKTKIVDKDANNQPNSYNTQVSNENNLAEASTSSIGNAIKVVSVIVLLFSIIGAFVIMSKVDFAIGCAMCLISVLIGLLVYGIGEICCLLTKINFKI